jgi:uncharacterized membrane protein YhhN
VTAALAVLTIGFGLLSAFLTEQSQLWSRVFKMLASTAMVALVFTGRGTFDAYALLVTGALLASWAGDFALSFKGQQAFLGGLISFALAQMLYTLGFFARSPMDLLSVALSGAVMAITAAAILRWLTPHVPDRLAMPVSGYIAIISVMVVTAFGTSGSLIDPRIPSAAVLFAISDVLVARQQFVAPSRSNRLVGLPTYYAAQVLFATTVVIPWT